MPSFVASSAYRMAQNAVTRNSVDDVAVRCLSPAPNGTFARFVVDTPTVGVAGVDWAADVVAAAASRTAMRVKVRVTPHPLPEQRAA